MLVGGGGERIVVSIAVEVSTALVVVSTLGAGVGGLVQPSVYFLASAGSPKIQRSSLTRQSPIAKEGVVVQGAKVNFGTAVAHAVHMQARALFARALFEGGGGLSSTGSHLLAGSCFPVRPSRGSRAPRRC